MGGSDYTNREVEGQVPEKAKNVASLVEAASNPKDANRKPVTEEFGVHEEWYKAAREVKTKEELSAFIDKLDLEYLHDYGTICHAIAAVAIAAAWVMERTDQGGITGFQAGAISWEFMRHWLHLEGPASLVEYKNMLYPQYQNRFEKVISEDTADWLMAEAKKLVATEGMRADKAIVAHWVEIASGKLPWGYTIKEED